MKKIIEQLEKVTGYSEQLEKVTGYSEQPRKLISISKKDYTPYLMVLIFSLVPIVLINFFMTYGNNRCHEYFEIPSNFTILSKGKINLKNTDSNAQSTISYLTTLLDTLKTDFNSNLYIYTSTYTILKLEIESPKTIKEHGQSIVYVSISFSYCVQKDKITGGDNVEALKLKNYDSFVHYLFNAIDNVMCSGYKVIYFERDANHDYKLAAFLTRRDIWLNVC